jgi:hypothetical protein
MIQLVSERDEPLGGALDVQLDVSQQQLQTICNLLLKQAHATTDAEEAYEAVPCQFYLDRELIRENLKRCAHSLSARTNACAVLSRWYTIEVWPMNSTWNAC